MSTPAAHFAKKKKKEEKQITGIWWRIRELRAVFPRGGEVDLVWTVVCRSSLKPLSLRVILVERMSIVKDFSCKIGRPFFLKFCDFRGFRHAINRKFGLSQKIGPMFNPRLPKHQNAKRVSN